MNEEYSLQRIILSKISSGVHPTIGPSYIRKIVTNEDKLDQMPIVEIERYLRKKKLEKLKNI
jgi:hypothetical protein